MLLMHKSSTESVRSVRLTFGPDDDNDSEDEAEGDDNVEPKKNMEDNEETHL